MLLHCNYQEGTEEQYVVNKCFKIIIQQLKSILKNILFWWIDCLNAYVLLQLFSLYHL